MVDLREGRMQLPHLHEFSALIGQIMLTEWKKALVQGLRSYNIKLYNIDKLSPKKVRQLYLHLAEKQILYYGRFYETEGENQAWHENELRLFVWVLVTYSYVLKKPLTDFGESEWSYLSKLFCGKNPWLCQFQYMNIRKTPLKIEKWTREEDELLASILNSDVERNRWNEIAKLLFYKSNRRHFRTAKQCRERWNNYLDPSKFRGLWSAQEDYILVSYVAREGKKWAQIAKALQGRRTEHTVKNRFKSLITKQLKTMSQDESAGQDLVLNVILQKLEGQIKIEAPSVNLNGMKIQEQSVDAAVNLAVISPKIQVKHRDEHDDHLQLLRSPFFGGLREYDSENIEFGHNEGFLLNEEGEIWPVRYSTTQLHYFEEEHPL